MKLLTLIFILSAFLGSCTTGGNYITNNTIVVYDNNNAKKNYNLLSVRGDSAIVVSYYDYCDSLHFKLIKRDAISRIEVKNTDANSGLSHDYSRFAESLSFGIVLLPVILPAMLVVDAITTCEEPPMEISMDSRIDRAYLRSFAVYPVQEPNEMRNVK